MNDYVVANDLYGDDHLDSYGWHNGHITTEAPPKHMPRTIEAPRSMPHKHPSPKSCSETIKSLQGWRRNLFQPPSFATKNFENENTFLVGLMTKKDLLIGQLRQQLYIQRNESSTQNRELLQLIQKKESHISALKNEAKTHEEIREELQKQNKQLQEAKKQQKEIVEVQKDLTCVVCLENNRNKVCQPCGHVCACDKCIESMRASDFENEQRLFSCPICREDVTATYKVIIC